MFKRALGIPNGLQNDITKEIMEQRIKGKIFNQIIKLTRYNGV